MFAKIRDNTVTAIDATNIASAVSSLILSVNKYTPSATKPAIPQNINSLVPGAGMYNTVYNIIASDYMKAMYTGIDTIKVAVAIAVGIVLVFALPNKMFFKRK